MPFEKHSRHDYSGHEQEYIKNHTICSNNDWGLSADRSHRTQRLSHSFLIFASRYHDIVCIGLDGYLDSRRAFDLPYGVRCGLLLLPLLLFPWIGTSRIADGFSGILLCTSATCNHIRAAKMFFHISNYLTLALLLCWRSRL